MEKSKSNCHRGRRKKPIMELNRWYFPSWKEAIFGLVLCIVLGIVWILSAVLTN